MFKKLLIILFATTALTVNVNAGSNDELILKKNDPSQIEDCFEGFNRATFGVSFGNRDLYKADPISENSIKLLSSHSILAPKSKTTFIPFVFGHNAAKAGLLTPLIVFRIIFEITKRTPVFPADKEISLSDLI